MPNPPVTAVREMPVWAWGEFDSVSRVKAAIRALEQGQFAEAALLCDAMRRDDRVAGALLTRTEALPALPFSLEEGVGAQAGAVLRMFEDERLFSKMCPDAAQVELQQWAHMLGIGVGENVWTASPTGRWEVRLRVWHPRWLHWSDQDRSYYVQGERERYQVTPGDGRWVVLAPLGLERAWMQGLVRSLYIPWLVRQWGLRDWARHSEVLGTPIRKAYVPSGAEKDEKEQFLLEVAALGAEATVRLPRVPGVLESEQFELELLEATASNGEGFDRLISKADACIAIRILGQNLSTEVKGGSFAAAKVHGNIRGDVLQKDAEALSPCLREQVLGPWCLYNLGDPALAPLPTWDVEPPEDKAAAADAMKKLGEGIAALRAQGAQPDIDQLLERAGIPVTGPAQEPPPPPPAAGASPGGLPRARPVATAAQTAENEDATAAELRGQRYTDQAAQALAGQGNEAISPMLATLLSCVMDAASFADITDRLERAFPRMDTTSLADLQQKAFILASLNGRLAVLEDLVDS